MCDFDVDHSSKFMKITKKTVDPITFSEKFEATSQLEDSLIDQTYYQGMKKEKPPKKEKIKIKKRRFNDEVEIFVIPDLDEKSIDDLFYSAEEMADMRHEAFLEQCGLSSQDFQDA